MSLETQDWPITRFREYPNNPRINDHAVSQMAATIKEFGFRVPMIVRSDGELIDGHLRLKAARVLGLQTLPVVIADDLTEVQIRALRIAVNQAATWAEWDMPMLKQELATLNAHNFDMPLLGFTADRVRQILANPQNVDPEDAPKPPKNPVSRPGDLWIMGGHRILCGDSTNPEDVARVMGKDRPVLMNTDAPYGVNYGDIANSRSRPASVRKGGDGKDYGTHKSKEIENDDLDGVALQSFLEKVIMAAVPHLIDNPAFYLWHPMLTQGTFFAAAAAADILIHRQIIWVKPSLIMGRGDYHWRHELCFYGWIRGKRCQWLTGRDQDTVWEIGRENDNIHPTQKPTELFRRPILNHTHEGDAVYEPFSGSGAQIIAAEMTARRCLAVEISPQYCDVAVKRWQKLSGREAVLETVGATFDEIARERGVEIDPEPVAERAPDTGALLIPAGELVTAGT